MATADSKFADCFFFFCSEFNLNAKNVNLFISSISRKLLRLTFFSFAENDLGIFNAALGKESCGIEISRSLLVIEHVQENNK